MGTIDIGRLNLWQIESHWDSWANEGNKQQSLILVWQGIDVSHFAVKKFDFKNCPENDFPHMVTLEDTTLVL